MRSLFGAAFASLCLARDTSALDALVGEWERGLAAARAALEAYQGVRARGGPLLPKKVGGGVLVLRGARARVGGGGGGGGPATPPPPPALASACRSRWWACALAPGGSPPTAPSPCGWRPCSSTGDGAGGRAGRGVVRVGLPPPDLYAAKPAERLAFLPPPSRSQGAARGALACHQRGAGRGAGAPPARRLCHLPHPRGAGGRVVGAVEGAGDLPHQRAACKQIKTTPHTRPAGGGLPRHAQPRHAAVALPAGAGARGGGVGKPGVSAARSAGAPAAALQLWAGLSCRAPPPTLRPPTHPPTHTAPQLAAVGARPARPGHVGGLLLPGPLLHDPHRRNPVAAEPEQPDRVGRRPSAAGGGGSSGRGRLGWVPRSAGRPPPRRCLTRPPAAAG